MVKCHFGIMNSFYGANHLVKEYGSTSIISFNSKLFSCEIVEAKIFTASKNIFTWQQAMCKTNWTNLSVLLEDHYTDREKIENIWKISTLKQNFIFMTYMIGKLYKLSHNMVHTIEIIIHLFCVN